MVITHRLAGIRRADRVLFLEDGRIIEDGSPGELLTADGRFAEFWRHQTAAADWRLTATGCPRAHRPRRDRNPERARACAAAVFDA
ncbi:hypothetical protein [Spirillospora sp. NPDC047279]|uniref:hypothetical protein n=1 Tax=Spirillospora sp. NPDC047279 TaxID=3155478 RepID=UPI0033D0FEAB